LSKSNYNNREFIKLKSINNKLEAKILFIFSSRTTFGLWKLHISNEIDQSETLINNLLSFDIQKFLFENYHKIPVDINMKNEIKKYSNTLVDSVVNDRSRVSILNNHPIDDFSEFIYYDINALLSLYSNFTEDKFDNIEIDGEDKIVMSENDKIKYIKDLKSYLVENFYNNFKTISKDVDFKYDFSFSEKIKIKATVIRSIVQCELTQYIMYSLVYDFSDGIKEVKNCNFIFTFLTNNSCGEYGIYNHYYDNVYNKLVHFVYDDECFLSKDIIDNLRLDENSNILFVGQFNSFV